MAKPRKRMDESDILSDLKPEELAFLKPEEARPPTVQVKEHSAEVEPEEPPQEVAPPKPKRKPTNTNKKSSLMAKLMESTEKEPTVRLTVDLAESVHRKLSILSARSGRKKAEIIRMLLDEALEGEDLDN